MFPCSEWNHCVEFITKVQMLKTELIYCTEEHRCENQHSSLVTKVKIWKHLRNSSLGGSLLMFLFEMGEHNIISTQTYHLPTGPELFTSGCTMYFEMVPDWLLGQWQSPEFWKVGLIEKMTYEKTFTWNKEVSHEYICTRISQAENNTCKGPETDACLACLRNSKEASVIWSLGIIKRDGSAAKQGQPLAKGISHYCHWYHLWSWVG